METTIPSVTLANGIKYIMGEKNITLLFRTLFTGLELFENKRKTFECCSRERKNLNSTISYYCRETRR